VKATDRRAFRQFEFSRTRSQAKGSVPLSFPLSEHVSTSNAGKGALKSNREVNRTCTINEQTLIIIKKKI
jgi:hypothetical protein